MEQITPDDIEDAKIAIQRIHEFIDEMQELTGMTELGINLIAHGVFLVIANNEPKDSKELISEAVSAAIENYISQKRGGC